MEKIQSMYWHNSTLKTSIVVRTFLEAFYKQPPPEKHAWSFPSSLEHKESDLLFTARKTTVTAKLAVFQVEKVAGMVPSSQHSVKRVTQNKNYA